MTVKGHRHQRKPTESNPITMEAFARQRPQHADAHNADLKPASASSISSLRRTPHDQSHQETVNLCAPATSPRLPRPLPGM